MSSKSFITATRLGKDSAVYLQQQISGDYPVPMADVVLWGRQVQRHHRVAPVRLGRRAAPADQRLRIQHSESWATGEHGCGRSWVVVAGPATGQMVTATNRGGHEDHEHQLGELQAAA